MQKIDSDEPKNRAMVLLKILALGNRQIEEGTGGNRVAGEWF